MKKYVVSPGHVIRPDGDEHFISAQQLMSLYRVSPAECIILDPEKELRGYDDSYLESLIWLFPKHNGNYKLPTP